jgi:hypothetical protein
MPAWVAAYLIGFVAFSAWARRDDFRGRGTATGASLELIGSVCLALPSLAYWDAGFGRLFGGAALGLLFGLGLLSLLVFGWQGLNKIVRNPFLTRRQRWTFAALGASATLLGTAPEVWWGGLALLHVPPT